MSVCPRDEYDWKHERGEEADGRRRAEDRAFKKCVKVLREWDRESWERCREHFVKLEEEERKGKKEKEGKGEQHKAKTQLVTVLLVMLAIAQ